MFQVILWALAYLSHSEHWLSLSWKNRELLIKGSLFGYIAACHNIYSAIDLEDACFQISEVYN